MDISFVIPLYNKAATIQRCIDEIRAQDLASYEILVIDDCSTDASVDLISGKYPEVRILTNDENSGAAYSRNRGIREALGEVMVFIDADVFLAKNSARALIDAARPGVVAYPRIDYDDGRRMYPLTDIEKEYLVLTTVYALRREDVLRAQLTFDEYYKIYFEDLDYFTRWSMRGFSFHYVEDAVAIHAIELDSAVRRSNGSQRYYLEVRNTAYFLLKFANTRGSIAFPIRLSSKNLAQLFVFGIFNFDWVGRLEDLQHTSMLHKVSTMLRKENRLANSGFLPRVYLRALRDVAYDYRTILENRRSFRHEELS